MKEKSGVKSSDEKKKTRSDEEKTNMTRTEDVVPFIAIIWLKYGNVINKACNQSVIMHYAANNNVNNKIITRQ